MNVILFLGSGVSVPSGLPRVDEISESILNGQYWHHTDTNFYPGQNPSNDLAIYDPTPSIQKLLQYTYEYAEEYLRRPSTVARRPNYEDLNYLIRQVQLSELGYEDNAAVWEFVKLLDSFVRNQIPEFDPHINYNLERFAGLASDYIQSVILDKLSKQISNPEGFELLISIIESNTFERISIVTLNHDTLVEKVLSNHEIDYTDGFGLADGDLRWYEPQKLLNGSGDLALIKPHGSINWYSFEKEYDHDHAIPLIKDVSHCKNEKGEMPWSSARPSFLSATGVKELLYQSGIFADMQDAFLSALHSSGTIIMSGFGWEDIGISLRLHNWLNRDKNRRIILLHKQPEEIGISSGLAGKFEKLIERNQLIVIEKWFCETSLEDLAAHINVELRT